MICCAAGSAVPRPLIFDLRPPVSVLLTFCTLCGLGDRLSCFSRSRPRSPTDRHWLLVDTGCWLTLVVVGRQESAFSILPSPALCLLRATFLQLTRSADPGSPSVGGPAENRVATARSGLAHHRRACRRRGNGGPGLRSGTRYESVSALDKRRYR